MAAPVPVTFTQVAQPLPVGVPTPYGPVTIPAIGQGYTTITFTLPLVAADLSNPNVSGSIQLEWFDGTTWRTNGMPTLTFAGSGSISPVPNVATADAARLASQQFRAVVTINGSSAPASTGGQVVVS